MTNSLRRPGLLAIAPLVCLFAIALGLLWASEAQAAGGTGRAWGYNASGQVGNGTVGSGTCSCAPVPVQISGLTNVTQIAGGYEHGLALLDDGSVMSWGYNSDGQLGDGTTTDRPLPAPVAGLANVVAVSAGSESSLVLLRDGTVMSWGSNEYGAVGDGTSSGPEKCGAGECSKVPRPVPGVSSAIAISSGDEYNLALLADGTVLGWGRDNFGMLGDGTGVAGGCECVPRPTPVPGLSGVVAISAGEYEATAVLADGSVRIWGYNKGGLLGTGVDSTNAPCFCLPPVEAAVSGVREVAAGGEHTMALLSTGDVKAWGLNRNGQVGNGAFSTEGCECVRAPTTILGLVPAAIAAGSNHGMALLSDGTGLSWGEGQYGQLGNGSLDDTNLAAPIAGLAGASEISRMLYGGFAIVGPSQTLNVGFAGAGSGTVGTRGIACPAVSCSAKVPQGQVRVLRATPTSGGFAGFSGPCTGTGTCQAKMGADQTVTATFGVPKGTAITSSKVDSKKKKATFSFTAPGAITGYECKLIKPKPKRKKGKGRKRVALAKKGKKTKPPAFAPCAAPVAYKNLKPGKYSFEVRALDILGADATPAVKKFTVKKPKPKKKKKK